MTKTMSFRIFVDKHDYRVVGMSFRKIVDKYDHPVVKVLPQVAKILTKPLV